MFVVLQIPAPWEPARNSHRIYTIGSRASGAGNGLQENAGNFPAYSLRWGARSPWCRLQPSGLPVAHFLLIIEAEQWLYIGGKVVWVSLQGGENMEASIANLSRKQISDFFSENPQPTQQECEAEAERITGTSVHPTALQGGTSFTVIGGTLVVQFRPGESALDLQLLQCVEQAYAGFVPQHRSGGKLGELHIYTMDDVGGISMYLARDQLHQHDCHLLRQTLQDYARFVDVLILDTCPEHGTADFADTGSSPRHGITIRSVCSVQAVTRS